VARLPVVSGKDLIKYLTKEKNFRVVRTSGSHAILRHNVISMPPLPIPLHSEIAKGTLYNILNLIGLEVDEFIQEWNDL
jgi:predicted RNA binding protein YcfA (HicA-like mRNA interferase family)